MTNRCLIEQNAIVMVFQALKMEGSKSSNQQMLNNFKVECKSYFNYIKPIAVIKGNIRISNSSN